MDGLSYQMLKMPAACTATYDKTDLISDLGKAASGSKNDDFQKMMDKVKSGQSDTKTQERPKSEKPAAEKADGQHEEEDPIEAAKRLQVYLVPVSPEELAQYPAEWLPQVEEGEPIVCIGVRTGANGEDIPILVGAKQAAQMYGKPVVDPALYDVSAPEADAMLKATVPGADNSPAAMLDRVVTDQFGKVVEQAVQSQEDDGDGEVKLIEVEQAPQRLFHDVKAAPVKVGEVYDAQQTEEPDVVGQVDTAIARALENGESTITVSLNPENLGEITVQMSVKTGGTLAVAISVHNDDTKALLERHAANLQELLSSRVKESVEVDIQRGQESQQNQQQQQNYEGHNGHAQDSREERRQQHREHSASSQDFMQQLRLGLIPSDGEA